MTKTSNIIKKIVWGVFILLAATATFFHRVFKEENPNMGKLRKEYNTEKKYWQEYELTLDSLAIHKVITLEEFFYRKANYKKSRKLSFDKLRQENEMIKSAFKFNGRSSKHYFFWLLGIFISFFTVSCMLAVKDARLKRAGLLKWYEPSVSIVFISVSLFWLYHTIFMTERDFEITIYTLFLVCILVPLAYFIYHFLRRSNIEEKLLENIQVLTTHVLKHTKEDKEEEKWKVIEKVVKNGK